MVKRIVLAATVIILFTNMSFAITAEEIFTRMKEAQNSIKQIKYKVTTILDIVSVNTTRKPCPDCPEVEYIKIKVPNTIVNELTIYLKSSGQYRMEFHAEGMSDFVDIYNGSKMWRYYPNTKKAIDVESNEIGKKLAPINIIKTADIENGIDFEIIGQETLDNEECILINKKGYIKLWISKNNWLVKKRQIIDSNNNGVTNIYEEIEINPNMDDSLFNFVSPEGTK